VFAEVARQSQQLARPGHRGRVFQLGRIEKLGGRFLQFGDLLETFRAANQDFLDAMRPHGAVALGGNVDDAPICDQATGNPRLQDVRYQLHAVSPIGELP
jgi:hypothetical protein